MAVDYLIFRFRFSPLRHRPVVQVIHNVVVYGCMVLSAGCCQAQGWCFRRHCSLHHEHDGTTHQGVEEAGRPLLPEPPWKQRQGRLWLTDHPEEVQTDRPLVSFSYCYLFLLVLVWNKLPPHPNKLVNYRNPDIKTWTTPWLMVG